MITEHVDARVSREDLAFAAVCIPTAFQTLKSNCEAYMPKSAVPDSMYDEAFPTAISAGSVPHNHHSSISLTTITESLKTSRKCKTNQAFTVDPIITKVQPGLYKNHCQLNVPNFSVSKSLYAGEVSCVGCATCKYQSNISPKLFITEPSVTCSDNFVFWPVYLHQQNPVMPTRYISVRAEVGNGTLPFVYTTTIPPLQLDGAHLPCYEAAACNLDWSKLCSRVMMNSRKLLKQQPGGQWRSPRTSNTSPLDHGSLKRRSLKGVGENFSLSAESAKEDCNTGLAVPNVCMTSPTLCRQLYDERCPPIINIPKCISIRADSHIQQLKTPNPQKTHVRVASNAATGDSPTELYRLYHHHHHFTPATIEVQEQTKVVALAENLTCLAFPQGMYKTEMCNKWVRSMGQYCPYGDKCQFAHGPHELRPVLRHHRYKTILCRMVAAGEPCPYEHRCHFRHVVYPHEAGLLGLNPISNSAWSTMK